MPRIRSAHVAEAEDLLVEVVSWSEDDIDQLPPLYQEKAREYRRLVKDGDD